MRFFLLFLQHEWQNKPPKIKEISGGLDICVSNKHEKKAIKENYDFD